MGAAIAKEALVRGYYVVATARKPEGIKKTFGNSTNLLTVKLDITNDEQIRSSVEAALERFGRIDGLVK